MINIFESVYDELFENGELYTLDECDGGAVGGDAAGADISPGGDAGPGGGITSDAVLGPGGGMEKGEGCLGKGDFHVPFPVMPCLFRYPCCNGGSKNKKKKGKKTVSVKNPYVKGMKTIVAEDGNGTVVYTGDAKAEYDRITGEQAEVFTGVLYYNDKYKLAWMVREDGVLHLYKPMDTGSFWTVYATTLTEDGMILLDYKAGKYQTEQQALDAVYKAAQAHRKALEECIGGKPVDESRFSPRDLMNWEAHGRDPRYFPKERKPEVNTRFLEAELKRRFPGQFEDVQISDRIGRWTVVFTLPLPDNRREICGQQRVAQVIPEINRIISFLRIRGVEVNQYDVRVLSQEVNK